jgi:hypothetical protein
LSPLVLWRCQILGPLPAYLPHLFWALQGLCSQVSLQSLSLAYSNLCGSMQGLSTLKETFLCQNSYKFPGWMKEQFRPNVAQHICNLVLETKWILGHRCCPQQTYTSLVATICFLFAAIFKWQAKAKLFPYNIAKLCNNLKVKYYLDFVDEQTLALRHKALVWEHMAGR